MTNEPPSIAFFDAKPYDIASFDRVNQEYGLALKYFGDRLNPDTVGLAHGFAAVCVFVNDKLDRPVVERLIAGGTRLIALRCAGYNNVDLKAVFGRMHVVRVPAYSPYAVAEHAVALMLSLNRKTHRAYFRTRDSNFSINGLLGFDMNGKTAGVIGTGKIGKVLTGILRGFGMNVLVHDAFPDEAWAATAGVRYVPLDELYAQADIISLHCPLTRGTHHMIGAEAIAKMKPGVMIINTGRGQLIDSRALIDALKTGRVGAAGLDVYEEESEYFFEDFSNSVLPDDVLARLLSFPNVLLTSHQAFFTREALVSIAATTLGNIKDFFGAQEMKNEICYRCESAVCNKKVKGRCF